MTAPLKQVSPQAGGGVVSEEWLCDALERAVGALASASEAERERAVAATKISAGWRVGTRFRSEIVSEKAKVSDDDALGDYYVRSRRLSC